jgi:transcriptional regulator with XRE-family HTH domain
MAQREELTRFLKAARGRLAPSDVGLPAGERRRTRGLRREEVATLSGMSVTWYTWFEQGREVQLSAAMIERLGKALRLEPQEREFLFALAQHRPPPLTGQSDEAVRPSTQQLMDSLSIPALVIVEDWTVVGWNALVTLLFRDYAPLPREERNLFRLLMTGERYQADPERFREMARRLVARFKWDYSRTAKPEVFDALIAEMREASATFREFWEAAEIRSHFEDVNSATLPDVGEIAFHHTSYAIEEVPGQRLILFAPADAASEAKLRKLALDKIADEMPLETA